MRRALIGLTASALMTMATAEAQAQTVGMSALLSGSNEVPGVLTGAGGTATVTVNTATQEVTYRVEVFNFPSGATAAHFHVGGPGLAGPVVVNFSVPQGISNDFTISGTARASDLQPRQAQGIGSWDDFIQALLLGQVYINVHSAVNGGGEIRGQVVRDP